eukprot:2227520-Rhodomonas_salina.1
MYPSTAPGPSCMPPCSLEDLRLRYTCTQVPGVTGPGTRVHRVPRDSEVDVTVLESGLGNVARILA